MTQKTKAALLTQATVIKNETTPSANTAVRVGQMIIDLIDSLVSEDDFVFTSDIVVVLNPGENLGPYYDGDTIPASGKTFQQVISLLATRYVFPTWGGFTFSGYSATVERGTTLSGVKSWTWSINPHSGVVSTIDIYDVSASTALLSNTPNDGSQSQAITTRTLTNAGDTQIWKGIAHDTGSNPSNIDSSQLITTARLKGYYGPSAASVTNSAQVKALPNSFFEVPGSNVIVLNTGTTESKFIIATTGTLVSVTDDDAFDAPIAFTLLGTIAVQDAAGTNYTINNYEYNATGAYSPAHHLRATITV